MSLLICLSLTIANIWCPIYFHKSQLCHQAAPLQPIARVIRTCRSRYCNHLNNKLSDKNQGNIRKLQKIDVNDLCQLTSSFIFDLTVYAPCPQHREGIILHLCACHLNGNASYYSRRLYICISTVNECVERVKVMTCKYLKF